MGREFILEERRAEAERRNRELELNGAQAERRQELAVQEQEMLHSSSTASLAGSASTRKPLPVEEYVRSVQYWETSCW